MTAGGQRNGSAGGTGAPPRMVRPVTQPLGRYGSTTLPLQRPLPSPDDTVDPLDAAATRPHAPLTASMAGTVLQNRGPESTQEITVENVLPEAPAEPKPSSRSKIATASQALSESRRAPPIRTSSGRIAIPRPAPVPSAPPPVVALSATVALPKSAPPKPVPMTSSPHVEIAAAIAECVPTHPAPPPSPSDDGLGRSPAAPEKYAEFTSQPPPPNLPIPSPSSTDLGFVSAPSVNLPPLPPEVSPPRVDVPPVAASPIVAPSPSAAPPFPDYPRPSALPLFVVPEPAPKKRSVPLVPVLVTVGVLVGIGGLLFGRQLAVHRNEARANGANGKETASLTVPPSVTPKSSPPVASSPPSTAAAPPSTTQAVASAATTASAAPTASASAPPSPNSAPSTKEPSVESPTSLMPLIPSDMTLVTFPRSAKGHRVYVDRSLFRDSVDQPVNVKCGTRTIKIGSSGKARSFDLPCGSTFSLP